MINATHTPGSWRVDPNFSGDIQTADGLLEIGRALRAEGGGQVVTLPSNAPPAKEAVANARLIAAAPELLAEMQRYLVILKRAESNPSLWGKLTEGTGIATLNGYRYAIAKATN